MVNINSIAKYECNLLLDERNLLLGAYMYCITVSSQFVVILDKFEFSFLHS